METNRSSAKQALLETVARLQEIVPSMKFEEEITLHAITPHMHSFKTTIGREVQIMRFFLIILTNRARSYGSRACTVCIIGQW